MHAAALRKLVGGRTHQIRTHLAGIGRPILGDRTYAAWRSSGPLTDHLDVTEFGDHLMPKS